VKIHIEVSLLVKSDFALIHAACWSFKTYAAFKVLL